MGRSKRARPRTSEISKRASARARIARTLLAVSLLGAGACDGMGDDRAEGNLSVPTQGAPYARPMVPIVDRSQPVMSSPFVLSELDPLSTFAADVDTASYDIFRRSVLRGALPAPETVRVEEYVNYFRYEYPLPAEGARVPFTVDLSAGTPISDLPTKILRVGIQGAIERARRAANLVFLVDVSGSMAAANKLPLVQQVLRETLNVLLPSDTVAIVTYAGDTQVALAPTLARDQARITSAISRLAASGGTNGSSGIELAYAQAEVGLLESGVNHVILCTDGDFNLGVTSDDALVRLIERKREGGVTLTALGVGERNNDAMMERVSNAGNGIYSVLYNEDQAVAYAHQRLLATTQHIAKDVKIQVEFNPEHVYAYRLIGYEDRALADDAFRDDRVDAGEVGSGHQVTALYELALTKADLPAGARPSEVAALVPEEVREMDPADLVRVRLRWKQPGSSADDSASEALFGLARSALGEKPDQLDPDTVWASGVASLAEVLRKSPYAQRLSLEALHARLTPLVGTSVERRELIRLWPEVVKHVAP